MEDAIYFWIAFNDSKYYVESSEECEDALVCQELYLFRKSASM